MRKLIVYDESCPMCRLYTKGMVALNTDGNTTRIGNHQLTDPQLINRVDRQRARHEIPMIDLDGGETIYGVDTWGYAFGRRSRRLTHLLSLNWLRYMLRRLYAFISYNRRIIITSAPGRWQLLDLQPDFRWAYRIPFIVLVLGLAGIIFTALNGSLWPVISLVVCQLLSVGLFVVATKPADGRTVVADYAGHLGMSLLIGGAVTYIGNALGWPWLATGGYALGVGQHFIRMYRLGLNPWLSVIFTAGLLLIANS